MFISWDPRFPSTKRISSGDTLLKVPTWKVPLKKWNNLCTRAATNLYIRVDGVDVQIPAGKPGRKSTSPTVTVGVQK